MGRVKEYGYEVAERAARCTGQDPWEVKEEWEEAMRNGMSPEDFFLYKSKKKGACKNKRQAPKRYT